VRLPAEAANPTPKAAWAEAESGEKARVARERKIGLELTKPQQPEFSLAPEQGAAKAQELMRTLMRPEPVLASKRKPKASQEQAPTKEQRRT
jgi:hypothetical protein